MSYAEGLNPSDFCHMEGHNWGREGGGICLNCGYQLRCQCGQFIREDGFDAHVPHCPIYSKLPDEPEPPL